MKKTQEFCVSMYTYQRGDKHGYRNSGKISIVPLILLEYLETSLWVASFLEAHCPTKASRAPLSKLWVISMMCASLSVCFTYDSAFP